VPLWKLVSATLALQDQTEAHVKGARLANTKRRQGLVIAWSASLGLTRPLPAPRPRTHARYALLSLHLRMDRGAAPAFAMRDIRALTLGPVTRAVLGRIRMRSAVSLATIYVLPTPFLLLGATPSPIASATRDIQVPTDRCAPLALLASSRKPWAAKSVQVVRITPALWLWGALLPLIAFATRASPAPTALRVTLGPISLSRDLGRALCVRAESTRVLLVPSLRQRVSHVPMPRHRQLAAQRSPIAFAMQGFLDLQGDLVSSVLQANISKALNVWIARTDKLQHLAARQPQIARTYAKPDLTDRTEDPASCVRRQSTSQHLAPSPVTFYVLQTRNRRKEARS